MAEGYPNLFQSDGEEDEEDDELTGSEKFKTEFNKRWGWTSQVKRVAEVTNNNWETIYGYNVVEFLNLIAFSNDSAKYEEVMMKEWRMRNPIK